MRRGEGCKENEKVKKMRSEDKKRREREVEVRKM